MVDQVHRLSDVINLIGGGTPKRSISEYWNGEIPWLSVKDFNHGSRYVEKSDETITQMGLQKSSTKLLKPGMLIISARGTVGELAQLKSEMAFNQSCYGIDAKTHHLNNDYLYYLLKLKIRELKSIAHGSVFDTITRDTFENIEVKIPSKHDQKAIAHILGTLDDKIELNQKMSHTLEEIAKAIFKSWFVDFDPVRAKVEGRPTGLPPEISDLFPDELVDSEIGEIPKGWELQPLSAQIKVNPKYVLKKGTDAYFVEMKCLSESTSSVSESYERIAESGQQLPDTRHVCIGDRESDMLELMLKARDLGYPADYLVRSQHNRVLPGGAKLWDQVMAQTPIGRIRFMLPAGRGRKSRMVEQDIRLQRLSLKDKSQGHIEVTCLIASEVSAPEGTKPVQWRLLSNREASTLEQASELIDWYRARWEIELFFLILKEGCRVERLQLSDKDRLESALAIYMVIAWRINRLMRLGRTVPELDAALVFEPDEWRAAFILNKKPVPKKMPTLNEVIRLIAQRGGFLARKGDGEPGAKTLWLGLQEIAIFVEGARYAREFSEVGTCV